jgi:hypothetical protein
VLQQQNGAAQTKAPKRTTMNFEKQCAEVQCKTLIDTDLYQGVECSGCNRRYCLKHRLQEEHDCAKLAPVGAKQSSSKEKGIAALGKLRAWTASKNIKTSTSSLFSSKAAAKASAAKELAALKTAAKGETTVPLEQRVYLHVEASADTTKAKHPSGKFYYGSRWTVGRLLDSAAKALQVENVNNRGGGEDQRLRVFHVEGGRVLAFGEKVGEVLVTGNTIVLVRGIGDPDPALIDLEEKK